MSGSSSSSSLASRGTAALALKLEPALVKAVSREAKHLKKSPEALMRAAVVELIEDLRDYREATARLKRNKGKRLIPLAEIEKSLGLGSPVRPRRR